MANRQDDTDSDATLVARTLGGEREAFGALVDRYERVIAALCRQRVADAAAAEDVLQEAFLKAYRSLASLRDPARFASWLYGIAIRATIDFHRGRERAGRTISLDQLREETDTQIAGGECPADQAVRREQAERVLAALAALPDRYRLVLTLRYQGHQSYREIAAHLGEPEGTIANRLHRAVARLKDLLADEVTCRLRRRDLLPDRVAAGDRGEERR